VPPALQTPPRDQKLVTAGQADIRQGSRHLAAPASKLHTFIADRHSLVQGMAGARPLCGEAIEQSSAQRPPPSHEMIVWTCTDNQDLGVLFEVLPEPLAACTSAVPSLIHRHRQRARKRKQNSALRKQMSAIGGDFRSSCSRAQRTRSTFSRTSHSISPTIRPTPPMRTTLPDVSSSSRFARTARRSRRP
jgi:hypothetical protein